MKTTLHTLMLGLALVPAAPPYAQTLESDAMPVHSQAERFVAEAPVASLEVAVPKGDKNKTTVSTPQGDNIVRTALQYLGARYRSGHSGPTAFDCSGFTNYVYGRQSINISRSSRTQFREGTPIYDTSALQKGDLVFFGGSRSSRTVGHVGIVTDVNPATGQFKFVHAARTGVKVDDSNSAYYKSRYIGARRIVQN